MVNVPLCAPLPVNVRVDVPVPPAPTVTLAGLKFALTPPGSVPVDNETVPLKPFSDVMVMVVEVAPFLGIVRLDGDAPMLKSPVTGAVTVRL
jgi:hypothetical protein